jgi:inner membrane protein
MDSLTQLTLGAAVGEAVAGKKAGNKAILWGAIAGTIPDLDVIAGNFMSTVDAMAFHRSITHSITFAIIISPFLGFLLQKIYADLDISWKRWTLLFFLGFFTHTLLDCFTTWGTQLLWPFADTRIAFKSIFVIDPLYTLPLLITSVWLMFLSRSNPKRKKLNIIGLSLSTFYLLITLVAKQQANQVFEASFAKENMKVERYATRPSPLNIILWTVNAESTDGYYTGYYSFFDKDKQIEYSWYPKDHQWLKERIPATENINQLIDLTNGWYTINRAEQGIIFNDLRFGTYTGWQKDDNNFVFSYKIIEKNGTVEVTEMERNITNGPGILADLWQRLWGNE